MSFDAIVQKSPRGSPARPSSLEEVLGRLVDPPDNGSNSQQQLEKIKQSAASWQDVIEYGTYIREAWNMTKTPSLDNMRARLLADALKLNKLVQDQIASAQDSQTLQEELEVAWGAAATNAGVAREVFQRAQAVNQDEELSRLRTRVSELEAEQSFKELISQQHQELLREVRAQATATQGIKSTTDGIAQALEGSLARQPTGLPSKRRTVGFERSASGDREPLYAGDQRRGSAPAISGVGGLQQSSPGDQPSTPSHSGARRSSARIQAGPAVQASQSSHEVPGSLSGPGFTFRFAPGSAPESNLGPPPPSSSQPLISIDDHSKPEQVLSNILVWDGSELFDQAELPGQIIDQLRNLVKDNLCGLDTKKKFETTFSAGINNVSSLCIWQRAGLKPKASGPTVGYHACHVCITEKRPCLLRIRDATRGQHVRPHLAPLPDDIRPQNATRQDPEYWVVPVSQS